MTEAEWLVCEDPTRLLAFLNDGNNRDRRLRLFSCGCYRRLPDCTEDESTRSAIEAAERFADALADSEELRGARTGKGGPHNARFWVTRTSAFAAAGGALWSLRDAGTQPYDRVAQHFRFPKALALLRDIFGYPFRPVTFSPSWSTSTAVALASQMYESRDFGAMLILADALQDAGCDSADVLDHCRGPGPHVRGCWVVDLVQGKE
ncbi:hypothetical protein VT84_06930 [Gemmata sp. SH-PL17]|uniref:hypothetical protein n=1 Tax=Gemmata sp. SH-PL17 TaxID=1630693 RepID=UPI00078CB27B|nr:hypothetical protein [Gemmata sp. SH-PL17]AMV24113.1 hypothetical protein VT84_06930 [Gemmata sp. SH-PL17]